MKVLLIDNYDSFTYNLAHDLRQMECVSLTIRKHDELTLSDIEAYDKVIISPGPGLPGDYGLIIDAIQTYYKEKPILGVCLGLQAMYEAFGGTLVNLPSVHHGVTSPVTILDRSDRVFENIPSPFLAGRYHSWVCDPASLPPDIFITAEDNQHTIMACRHASFPLHGIQFHPESFLTPYGKKIMENFINLIG